MQDMGPIGKILIFAGIAIALLGVFIAFGSKFLPLGRLPGDIFIRRGNTSFFFPVVTCIIMSIILTIILNLFIRR